MAIRSFLTEEGRRIQPHHSELINGEVVLWDLERKRWLQSETAQGRWRQVTPEEAISLNNRSRSFLRSAPRNQIRQAQAVANEIQGSTEQLGLTGAVPILVGQDAAFLRRTQTTTSAGGITSRRLTKLTSRLGGVTSGTPAGHG